MKGKALPSSPSRIQDILSWYSAVVQLKVMQKTRGHWGERGVLFSRGTLVPLTSTCCFSYRVFPHVDSISVQISLTKQPTFCDATLVSPWSEVWETTAEISYWWRINTQIWVVLSISWSKVPSQHGPIRRTTQIWVVTRYQYGISRGKKLWRREISAVFSG